MKIKLYIAFVFVGILLIPFALQAQEQKFGYVNTDLILKKMPAYKNAKQQLQALSKRWKDKLKQMKKEIERLKEELKLKNSLGSKQIRKNKRNQIEQKKAERQQFMNQKFGPEGDYAKAQKRLLKPIQQKIYQAITAVSERMKIDFVFDRAQNKTLLYARDRWNLNQEILRELDITLTQ